MKKCDLFLSLAIFLFMAFTVSAQTYISAENAQTVAVNFMKRISKSTPVIANVKLESMNDMECIYKFIFSDSSWCIVPANRIAHPILAYGLSPHSDENDGLNYLIDWYKAQISSLGMRTDVCEEVNILWDDLSHDAIGQERYIPGISLLNSTGRGFNKWNQYGNNSGGCSPSYNQYCPISDSCDCGHKPVGCGAVAIGQVLWYWSWAKYNSFLQNRNWEMLPNELRNTTPSDSSTAIATFLRDCGTVVDMTYWCPGSWTFMENIESALQDHGYESAKKYLKSDWSYGNSWLNLIRSEIDNGRLVIYYGDDGLWTSGHFFVIDGYDAINPYLFHINYGHGHPGSYATLYTITDYPYHHRAIVGISPKYPQNITQLTYNNVPTYRKEVAVSNINLPNSNNNLSVEDTGTFHLVAGNEIVLSPGFHAKYGCNFSAKINNNLVGAVNISVPFWPNAYLLNTSSPFYIYAYNANSVECYIKDRNGHIIFQRAGSVASDTINLWDGTGASGTGVYTCYVRLKNSYGRYLENLFTITAIRGEGSAKGDCIETDVPETSLWDKDNEKNDIAVYPNPTNGIVHISVPCAKPFNIYVRNETGQLIYYDGDIKVNQYDVDLSHFPRGLYLVSIETYNNILTKKLTLQ